MFSIEPYYAEFQEYAGDKSGGIKSTWKPCRVVGIMKDAGGDPVYIIEITQDGTAHLREAGYVRKRP